MTKAIVGGTGIYEIPGVKTIEKTIYTQYGEATIYVGQGDHEDLVFLTRHGTDHSIPPHKVNYRANIAALKKLNVSHVLAVYCVGSLKTMLPPGGMALLDQFIDYSMHRESTFFMGGDHGLGHTDMVQPYCPTLRNIVQKVSQRESFDILPNATYLSFNGPRFETAAEIRMFAQLGGDVIGMTGASETTLAREAGLHFAAVAYSVNYGAGLVDSSMKIEKQGLQERLDKMLSILIDSLREPFTTQCICDSAVYMSEEPKIDIFS